MDKDKALKIAGIGAVSVAVISFAVFGLSQTKGNPIYGFFNNSANELKPSKIEKDDDSEEVDEKSKLSADSEEAKRDAENSRFAMNKINSWSVEDILKKPQNADYQYKKSDPERKVENTRGVNNESYYKKQIESFSSVYQNRKYRNATDETYEKARNSFSDAMNLIQEHQKQTEESGGASGKSEDFQKIMIEHFNSDGQYLKNVISAMQISKSNLELDADTFRLKMTSNESKGVYAFEAIMKEKSSGQQYAYVSGYYNSKLDYFDVTSSIYLLDGAVGFDKWTYDAKGIQ